MFGKTAAAIKKELAYYKALAVHERTPRASKWLMACAFAYLASPIDLIPDFIPVLGQLDDLAIVPLLVWLALKLIPADVRLECRKTASR
jgi:uncharacterized membrane protein YkvA (DUF1232 family)